MAFGCRWQSEVPLHAFEADVSGAPAEILVNQSTGPPPYRGESISTSRLRNLEGGSRFVVEDVVTIDTYRGSRIEIYPGPGWTGTMPVEFFGSVAGVVMTWRGALAMHGSAVEVGGKAILICGESGAGKSTLAAALIGRGARLISDDLSILHPRRTNEVPLLYAGRRTMRLFPGVAEMLGELVTWTDGPYLVEQKMVVVPPRVEAEAAIPLGLVVVLGEDGMTRNDGDAFEQLQKHFFRRRAYARIPGFVLRQAQLKGFLRVVPFMTMGQQEARDRQSFGRMADYAEEIFARTTVKGS